MQKQDGNINDAIKMQQQKIGNLELLVHSMMELLDEEDIMTSEEIDQKAKELVDQMKGKVEKESVDINTDD
jgi:hypothetical protein